MANYNIHIQKDRTWSHEEDLYLKEHFMNTSDETMGVFLNRTVLAVKSRRLKICGSRDKNRLYNFWSEEDLIFLKDNAGSMTSNALATRLNRSETAVQKQLLKILGTSDLLDIAGLYSTTTIAKLIGNTSGNISYWIKNKELPASKRKLNTKRREQSFYYVVELDTFYRWLEANYKNIGIDFSKVDLSAVSYHPEWFISEYKEKNVYGRFKSWSLKEEALLLHYIHNTDLSNTEIAEKLNRSYRSVCGKVSLLIKRVKTDKEYLKELSSYPLNF